MTHIVYNSFFFHKSEIKNAGHSLQCHDLFAIKYILAISCRSIFCLLPIIYESNFLSLSAVIV